MDANHVEAAINFPNMFPRFCGQGFLEREDKELALACVQIYNDWMIDEWCGGAGHGRLIPLTLVPLWDPRARRRRGAALRRQGQLRRSRSARTRRSSGCPSLYTRQWDALWAACEETETTVSMHIGSSSRMPTTSPDAPLATSMSLYAQNAEGSLCDWVFSGTLERFPTLKIAYAESQVGWMPFHARADGQRVGATASAASSSPVAPPASRCAGRVFGCIFDDLARPALTATTSASSTILFETDYPHADGTFPHSRKVAHGLFAAPAMNAEEC